MTDLHNNDYKRFVTNLIDNAVVPNPNATQALKLPFEWRKSGGTGTRGQRHDRLVHSTARLNGQRREFLLCAGTMSNR